MPIKKVNRGIVIFSEMIFFCFPPFYYMFVILTMKFHPSEHFDLPLLLHVLLTNDPRFNGSFSFLELTTCQPENYLYPITVGPFVN